MNKLLWFLIGLIILVIAIGFACFYHPDNRPPVDLPVAIYFPDEGTREIHEEKFVNAVEELDKKIELVSFYISRIKIKKYDLIYDHKVSDASQYTIDDAIGIYFVSKIKDGKARYGGFAFKLAFCHRSMAVLPWVKPEVFVHEMGHLFGLSHRSDPDNFMHREVSGLNVITDQQQETMYLSALGYTTCLPQQAPDSFSETAAKHLISVKKH